MAAFDKYKKFVSTLDSPGVHALSVTPNDTTDLTVVSRSVYVGTGGNLEAILAGDTTSVIFMNVPAGSMLPIRVSRIRAAGTTASNILVVW